MTANQINYARLVEEQRHNVVSEGQEGMANIIAERNAETNRLNALTNQYSANIRAAEAAEQARANRANELLVSQRQAEMARYQQESNRQEHERNYNQRVSNQLRQQEIDTQRYVADLNARTAIRNQNISTVGTAISSVTSMIGPAVNGMVGILRLIK